MHFNDSGLGDDFFSGRHLFTDTDGDFFLTNPDCCYSSADACFPFTDSDFNSSSSSSTSRFILLLLPLNFALSMLICDL